MPQSEDHSDLRYVVVEGCIGVGKTTLTHLLSKRLEARTVLEVVEENPFLPEFYEDPVAHAFKTQMFFLLSRFKQQEELHQGELFQQTTVSDYLFAKDRIFAELTLNESEMGLYDQVFNALKTRVPVPDLVIHLQAPMEVILERIQRRGRSFERDIDPDYLERLVDAYQRHFARFDDCPVLFVDTEDLNFPERHEDAELVMQAATEVVRTGEQKRLLTGKARQPSLV
jgi:deoxyadenosine/deoxycytidine kinase